MNEKKYLINDIPSSARDIIKKAGSWYSYQENRIGQGLPSVRQFLEDNPGLMLEIENKIKNNPN